MMAVGVGVIAKLMSHYLIRTNVVVDDKVLFLWFLLSAISPMNEHAFLEYWTDEFC